MMKRVLFFLSGLLLMGSLLTFREWLLLNEVHSTQALIRSQVDDQLDKAVSMERIHYLTTSSVVFERYLAPIFEVTNRLLWPPLRQKTMSAWKRSVHTKIEDLVVARSKSIESEMGYEVGSIRKNSKADFKRLVKIIDATKGLSSSPTFSATLKEEIKLIQKHQKGQDRKTFLALKIKGRERIRMLRDRIYEMDEVQLTEFLTSEKFITDVQSEVIDYILGIQNEKLRRKTWGKFEKKLLQILNRKQLLLARARREEQMAQHDATEPFAEAFAEETNRLFPEIKDLEPQEVLSKNETQVEQEEYLLPEN